ncbi:DEAD/DEAH box helicase [Psychrobium sp. 1_MG-2023]|uniref:DEAD/DEAH box helicase n=1 Tax=Psychrobium sp. 1_MG-2023 TaxID=3062624 RepID=UPI000C340901|nr:DEAD/DEAH box helicase [Psychrobium sp. 1_MG-2023]MDP2562175.1 DEAD/DEAH box helicase [Psychrobium sp. 1_MG-2023]PKF58121.1 ATP-dependent RNA helicase [Alteromonadales bacterium alter-6D02]
MSDTTITFSDLELAQPLHKALADLGYERPSPVQAAAIPHMLKGKDVMALAQTGTGKTAAFALPLLTNIDVDLAQPQILVMAPTRELAIQVAEAFQAYSRYIKGFHVLPIYGGQAYPLQIKALKRGPQVIVGTPGRLLDHLNRGTLKLDNVKAMVLDEADEMLRMGFIDDVETMMAATPKDKQTALFSATMPDAIKRIGNSYMNNPEFIKIEAKTATVENIDQRYWFVRGNTKMEALTRILETETYDGVIIFSRTKTMTVEIAEKLEARGYSAAAINGDMTQQLRERTINRLKNGGLDILVATDVAARGLDVPRLDLVINYDIPYDAESYVHRIGRTGRAGRSGNAILFVAPREKRMLYTIEKLTRQRVAEMSLPSRDDISAKRIETFRETLDKVIKSEDLAFYRELSQTIAAEDEATVEELAAALLFMAQKDKPLQLEPEPPRRERRERDDRDNDRGRERGGRDNERGRERGARQPRQNINMDTFRIEVGRADGVQVKNIVGAIANEGNLDSQYIGGIRLHDSYTTVELPSDMPKETMDHLYKAFVCSKAMKLTKLQSGTLPDDRPRRNSREGGRDGGGQRRDGGNRNERGGHRGQRNDSRGHRGQRNDSRGGQRDNRGPRRDRNDK